MNIKQLLYGMSTFLPGLSNYHSKGTGGTDSARYCYSVWMRHLVMAANQGLLTTPHVVVGELGPGDSIGIGLAALLSGVSKYYGMDVVRHASLQSNNKILDELLTLFKNKSDIPDDIEFPDVIPKLDSYRFPDHIITAEILADSLADDRIERIRRSLENCELPQSMIRYAAPWYGENIIEHRSIDMFFSQAVLEHVDDLEGAYKAMKSWLKPAGFISHTIDFKSHGLSKAWNGHWAFSDLTWKLIRGRRPFLLNRKPYSFHATIMKNCGFKVANETKVIRQSDISQEQLADKTGTTTPEDMEISVSFIQAVLDDSRNR